MTAQSQSPWTEVVIGCEGSDHALKIIAGRHVRWQCRRSRCLKKAELMFGRRMRVFHYRDLTTGEMSAQDEYEDVERNVE